MKNDAQKEATHSYKSRPCYYINKEKTWIWKDQKHWTTEYEVHFVDGKQPEVIKVKPSDFNNRAFQRNINLPKTKKALQSLLSSLNKPKPSFKIADRLPK